MGAKQAAIKTLSLLKKQYPDAVTTLSFGRPIEVLVATILSAQCTDARVNIVTKSLFKKYRTTKDYANADIKKFEQEIRSTGFYHNKAKNIINACKIIEEKFHGKVPKTMGELMALPGVARKTANIVLSEAYGIIEGIAVDTHVKRLSQRIGLSKNKYPNRIEQDLMKIISKKEWRNISNVLIFHGRRVCIARKPKCGICVLNKFCISAFKV